MSGIPQDKKPRQGYQETPATSDGAQFESTRHSALGAANSGNMGEFEEHLAHLSEIAEHANAEWAFNAHFQVEYDGYALLENWATKTERPPKPMLKLIRSS